MGIIRGFSSVEKFLNVSMFRCDDDEMAILRVKLCQIEIPIRFGWR